MIMTHVSCCVLLELLFEEKKEGIPIYTGCKQHSCFKISKSCLQSIDAWISSSDGFETQNIFAALVLNQTRQDLVRIKYLTNSQILFFPYYAFFTGQNAHLFNALVYF